MAQSGRANPADQCLLLAQSGHRLLFCGSRSESYFTQSFKGTAGRFGQFIAPEKKSDRRAL